MDECWEIVGTGWATAAPENKATVATPPANNPDLLITHLPDFDSGSLTVLRRRTSRSFVPLNQHQELVHRYILADELAAVGSGDW
jgi:hypothetical protein